MDLQDVSEVGQYVQMLERQKQHLKMCASYKGTQPPYKKPRSTIINGFLSSLRARTENYDTMPHHMLSTFISDTYLPSAIPSKSLRRISIRDLRLETHHRGSYLLVRTVTPPSKMTGIMTVVEDEDHSVEFLQIYNLDEEQDFRDIIPMNKICLIKEPYYKMTADGGFALRVDHVSDLLFPNCLDNRIPLKWRDLKVKDWTAEDWRNKGNTAVRTGNFIEARERYLQHSQVPCCDVCRF